MSLTLRDLEICYSLAKEAKEIRGRIEEIRAMAERCTQSYSGVPGGSLGDKVANGAVEMADYFAEREKVARGYMRHVRAVEAAIDELCDSEERRVMRHWYVDGMIVEEIVLRMHLSRTTVYERRRVALKKLGIFESPDTFGQDSDV